MSQFSHLHVHTQFSLLDGAASIKNLYKKSIENNMPAVAITDHGNMFGVFEFVSEAYKHTKDDGTPKVKPIVGCEFYITENRFRNQFSKTEKDPRNHQILLAKNAEGYHNLIKLCSLGYTEGLYSKYPRIDKELILKYNKGLIATTCCLGALVPQTILKKGEDAGETEFKWWLDIFGEDYYVELQRHGLREQDIVNEVLLQYAKKYNVKIIVSNDSHYIDQEDSVAHDILLCVNTGEKLATPKMGEMTDDDVSTKGKRFAFPNDEFYFKTRAEMLKKFPDLEQGLDNTQEIVDKVELLQLKKDVMLPFFNIPDGFLTQDQYLRHLTMEGAHKKYKEITAEVEERINFELGIIEKMGFAGYFLIVADFIKAGRDMGVFIGPGRGSAAGSVVAYCISITNIDPVKYKLLFERFLNPDRKSMPDIDTDFDDEGRQKVIDYVVQKYTNKQVAQIITYGTMAAKSSIADVARVMDLPIAESRALSGLVPDKPGTSLGRCLKAPFTGEKSLAEKEDFGAEDIEKIKKLREIYNTNSIQADILKQAEKLEGSVRNTGIHAAGIIIAPEDLSNIIPVCTAKDSSLLITQIQGSVIEDAGVLKMDFLGLKTLNILKSALEIIKENYNIVIDLDEIPLDDLKTYQLYQRGDTNGTFQFESPGMQKHLRDLKPDKFGDLIAMNALYRPGPIAYIPKFIERKHGREQITYDVAEMEEFLDDTYGITVYQEQVMLLSQKLANFSKGDADVLRKAMGKKQKSVLDKMKAQFLEGTSKNGHAVDVCEKIWTDWEAFAQYAFNKSHSTCYAFVAYQTAYLKAHYPSEYMAAVLNHAGSIDKITFFMEECRKMRVEVLGPEINESSKGFTVNKKGQIRFGFAGIKGVGDAAIDEIIKERKLNGPYKDIYEFVKRLNQRSVNKKSIEGLVYSGALDSFTELTRAQYFFVPPNDVMTGLERIVKFGNQVQQSKESATNSLFGDTLMQEIPNPKIPTCPPWNLTEQLEYEKDVIGMYLSGHPLDHFRFEMQHYDIMQLSEFNSYKDNISTQPNPTKTIRIAGLVTKEEHRLTKTGKKFGSYTIEDYFGKTEFALFGDDYVKMTDYFKKGNCIMANATFNHNYEKTELRLKLLTVSLLENVRKQLSKQIVLQVEAENVTKDLIAFLEKNWKKNQGNCRMKILIQNRSQERANLFSLGKGININDELITFLEENSLIDVKVVSS
jgi:DNA polymerase III subunit alpha